MNTPFASEEEKLAHEKKMSNYLTLFSFLLIFLIGYYFGMHYAAFLAGIFTLGIGYYLYQSETPIWKQTWNLASPYAIITAVGVINPAIIPVGLAGVVFTFLGLHLKSISITNSKKILLAVSALALAGYGSLIEYPKYVQNILAIETNEKLPNFEVLDMDGNVSELADFHGKVVVIDYWATWCKPCRDEFKELEKVVHHFNGNEDVVFLITNAYSSGDDFAKVTEFVSKNEYQLPFFKDQNGLATEAVQLESFPTLIIIDKKGIQRIKHVGYSNAENLTHYLQNEINKLLEE
jgi:thiol-disulfide isomerase/thioredoxin